MQGSSLVSVMVLVAVLGCARGRAVPPSVAGEVSRSADALDRDLDGLEARLLADQARVRFWSEMRDRHQSVSAIAAVNLERHAESIGLLEDRQRGKRDDLARKNRVASRLVPAAQATR